MERIHTYCQCFVVALAICFVILFLFHSFILYDFNWISQENIAYWYVKPLNYKVLMVPFIMSWSPQLKRSHVRILDTLKLLLVYIILLYLGLYMSLLQNKECLVWFCCLKWASVQNIFKKVNKTESTQMIFNIKTIAIPISTLQKMSTNLQFACLSLFPLDIFLRSGYLLCFRGRRHRSFFLTNTVTYAQR